MRPRKWKPGRDAEGLTELQRRLERTIDRFDELREANAAGDEVLAERLTEALLERSFVSLAEGLARVKDVGASDESEGTEAETS